MMINTDNHHHHHHHQMEMQNYIAALQQERKKIQVFERELPLSLQLVQQAIETCKQQLSGEYCSNNDLPPAGNLSECSEQTTSSDVAHPVFEEFIPIKRTAATSSSSQSDGEEEHEESDKVGKSEWLRSAQLWNQTTPQESDPEPKQASTNKSDESNGGFKKDKSVENGGTPSPAPESGGGNKKEDKDGNRKARRCWSPELHRRFLNALQHLGGSHVATPKQIRELMKVEGLTNDEVKSHLQKYRLHTRRPSPQSSATTQAPQFVVVGGIWVPPEYATIATTPTSTSPPNGIYAPVASIPQVVHRPLASNGGGSNGGDNATRRSKSTSPATSSSTYVTGVATPYSDY